MSRIIIPEGYRPKLNIYQTQTAIGTLKPLFERHLGRALNLKRVSAPLFVDPETGLNDNLSGWERPVSFDIRDIGRRAEVVQSLAKWKRMALGKYGFEPGEGLFTDMNAIRRDEELSNLHSIYVDQWDWEKVITVTERTELYLEKTVSAIVHALINTLDDIQALFPQLTRQLKSEVSFVTSQELEDRWPDKTAKERENLYCREHTSCFIKKIGGALRSGKPHDGRAPDYDDWELNGDLLIWDSVLEQAVEISSMGVRVDAESMARQLRIAACEERAALPFHQAVLSGQLPLSIGGGIGQSRVSMLILEKAHIAEVQASVWDEATLSALEKANIPAL